MTLLACGLKDLGFDISVCALTRSGPYEKWLHESDVPLTVIGKRWKFDPFAARRLRQHIRQQAPDIVHTWLFAANSFGRWAAKKEKVPTIVAGERCVDLWKQTWHFLIDRWLAKGTKCIVTNSSGVREFYAKHGIDANKFEIIPNGVSEPPPACAASREEILDELKLPRDSKLIGTVGRLWPQKRQKDLVWGAELLRCVRDDVHLLIIGEGPQRWRLERYTYQMKLKDKVHFLGHREDVPRLMPHFDCLWLASDYEGQSNSILEAMALGIPVVASDIAGNRDLVVNEETGYLVTPGDRAGYAKWTLKIIEDDALAKRLGAAAKDRIRNHFSVESMVQRHVELYERL